MNVNPNPTVALKTPRLTLDEMKGKQRSRQQSKRPNPIQETPKSNLPMPVPMPTNPQKR